MKRTEQKEKLRKALCKPRFYTIGCSLNIEGFVFDFWAQDLEGETEVIEAVKDFMRLAKTLKAKPVSRLYAEDEQRTANGPACP